ncbi:hypothetical protein [Thioalkalivibrio paradoxus]|uniref:Uncharacterized protein n=1 Tax=Thioalkalivibrio paradoxus ARh 1 TaxID=713585 RepID=W0DS68_9GAMM|nr:hypothetical protein [Thioalkalivibrio paradoxus]AHE99823.1 hypothetical protein THITH_01020 [Thioalkalivibrio paradoxus ARh 1]
MLFHQLTQAARQAAHVHGLRLCEFTLGALLTHVRVTDGARMASGPATRAPRSVDSRRAAVSF